MLAIMAIIIVFIFLAQKTARGPAESVPFRLTAANNESHRTAKLSATLSQCLTRTMGTS